MQFSAAVRLVALGLVVVVLTVVAAERGSADQRVPPISTPTPSPEPVTPSPLIVRDEVTISVDSSGNWPTDAMRVADSYGIPADWGSYSAHPYIAADPSLAARVAEVHQRGKLFLIYLTAGKAYTGNGFILDRRPELMDYMSIDIDGRPITHAPPGLGFTFVEYRPDMNEEGWREFLRSEMAVAIDAGVDGFLIDDIQAQTLEIGYETAGVFNDADMRGFREFLKTVYTPADLASRYGIGDVEAFDYRNFIIGRQLTGLWRSAPWEVPLFNQFRVFEYQSTVAAYVELFDWARSYSLSRSGKPIVFLGNTSTGGDLSLPFELPLDLAWLEFPYLQWGYPPRSKTIPVSKLSLDGRWKKGTFLTQVPTNTDLYFRGSPTNLSKVLFAEAHAARAEYQVPYRVVGGGGGVGYSPDLRELAPYYQFLAQNREYFGREWTWPSRVAVLYPVSAYLGGADDYYGAATALLESGIQFDALVSGDGHIVPNLVTQERLRQYPVLVLASPGPMSAEQVQLVLDYLEAGGHVVTWGSVGNADELYHPDVPRPPDWRTVQAVGERRVGAGTVHNLSTDELGKRYFTNRDPSARAQIVNAITRVVQPEVVTGVADVVGVVYQHGTSPTVVLHLVNYNYDIESDSVAEFHNVTVRLGLPPGFTVEGKRARLLSPDFSEALDVPLSVSGGTMFFEVPRLAYYGLLVVEPGPASPADPSGH